jgi:hypothetical protein
MKTEKQFYYILSSRDEVIVKHMKKFLPELPPKVISEDFLFEGCA